VRSTHTLDAKDDVHGIAQAVGVAVRARRRCFVALLRVKVHPVPPAHLCEVPLHGRASAARTLHTASMAGSPLAQ